MTRFWLGGGWGKGPVRKYSIHHSPSDAVRPKQDGPPSSERALELRGGGANGGGAEVRARWGSEANRIFALRSGVCGVVRSGGVGVRVGARFSRPSRARRVVTRFWLGWVRGFSVLRTFTPGYCSFAPPGRGEGADGAFGGGRHHSESDGYCTADGAFGGGRITRRVMDTVLRTWPFSPPHCAWGPCALPYSCTAPALEGRKRVAGGGARLGEREPP
ncbi:hypothetical protein HNQ64_002961 [Prosthecobacter dejongeii]|uniref:Uncharacterized protein n=1 Tax=Prosthecobacter dejongeii TaxID=48465 RepID=A0A7W7YM31_9BACT|nr:hypothetical protein [Prosthecobacter dejongeii]